MVDWEGLVGHGHWLCSISGREIAPGEEYVSALVLRDGILERLDQSAAVWSGTGPPDTIAWWRRRRPRPEEPAGPRLVDHRVLLEIFRGLQASTDRPGQCLLWIVTLLLVRARKLRYLDLERDAAGAILLIQERGGARARGYRVRDPGLSDAETERLQEQVARLFEEGAPAHGGGGEESNESGGGSSPQPPAA